MDPNHHADLLAVEPLPIALLAQKLAEFASMAERLTMPSNPGLR
jgi:hypothetical protein